MADLGVEFQPAPVSRSRGPSAAPSTPEQLLAARAVWIEAREVAETGGQRQGASRRIRTIERELRARGIEFEPADLGRPPRRSAPAPLTPEELLDAHAALVKARASAQTRGARQGATRRIRNIEAALTDRGIEFEPADLGRPPRRSAPAPSTPEELLDAHAALVETWRSAQTAGVKAGATRRIRKIEAAMADLGVEFQPAPVSRSRGPSAAPSTPEQLLAARAVWIEAREVAETGGQRQGASRRIRTIERELRARGIEFEPAALAREPPRVAARRRDEYVENIAGRTQAADRVCRNDVTDRVPEPNVAAKEVLDPALLRQIRAEVASNPEVLTIADRKPNWVREITPEGVWVDTLRSRAAGRRSQLVNARMIQVAWDYLQAHGSLTSRYLLDKDGLNVKRSSFVCALLARLPDVEVACTAPITLTFRKGVHSRTVEACPHCGQKNRVAPGVMRCGKCRLTFHVELAPGPRAAARDTATVAATTDPRLSRLSDARSRRIDTCPHCGQKNRVVAGLVRCGRCRMTFHVEREE